MVTASRPKRVRQGGCPSARAGLGGFTVVEAVIALTLSTVIVGLVLSVFLAQNRFYSRAITRSQVQENARAVTELISTELRTVAGGGVQVAQPQTLVVRSPLLVGVVCRPWGSGSAYVYFPTDGEGIDGGEVSGYGLRQPDGSWDFYPASWASLNDPSGGMGSIRCAEVGSDTTGVSSDYVRLNQITAVPSPPAVLGTVIMLYREREFRIQASELYPGAMAFFQGPAGDTLTEFATGMTADAGFAYSLTGDPSFVASVTGTDLGAIDVVRLTSRASSQGLHGAASNPYEYGWTVEVPLLNAR